MYELLKLTIRANRRYYKKTTLQDINIELEFKKAYARGEVSADEVRSTLMSYLGYMKHADCYNLKRKMLSDLVLVRTEVSKLGQKDYERITTLETQLVALSKGDAYSANFFDTE